MTRSEAGILSGISRRLPEDVIQEMLRLRREGYSYEKIAIILNENPSSVFRYCKRVGL